MHHLLLLTLFLTGCASVTKERDWFSSGRDRREFNSTTQRYEWPR